VSTAGDVPTADQFDQAINPNSCVALRSATQSIPNNSSTAISFDGEEFDNSSMITPTSSTITIQEDGLYLITAEVAIAANATGIRGIEVIINGGTTTGAQYAPTIGTVRTHPASYSNAFLLTAGDTVSINAYQNSGGALNAVSARASVTRITGN